MAHAGDHLGFRPHDRQQLRPGIAVANATTTMSCKRKAADSHPEAPPAGARRQSFSEDDKARAVATAAKSSDEAVKLDRGSRASENNIGSAHVSPGDQLPPRAETEDGLLDGDRPASKNGGSTVELPIIIDDDDDGLPCPEPEPEPTALNNDGMPCPETEPEPEPAAPNNDGLPCPEPEPAASWYGDNTLVSPFGYRTWDPTDGGRYELLSTYVPPPCLDPDEEDALWWLAAVHTAPELYTSPADIFWGTPDGVWTLY